MSQSYSNPNVGRFLRHGVVGLCLFKTKSECVDVLSSSCSWTVMTVVNFCSHFSVTPAVWKAAAATPVAIANITIVTPIGLRAALMRLD